MINAEAIGKRIRTLRKERNISQEKMAEDLGLYQADISNLERATSGSGVTDLFKLEQIADYFEVPLAELLSLPLPRSSAETNVENEKDNPDDYVLLEATFDYKETDSFICASELKVRAKTKEIFYFSFVDVDGKPRIYKSKKSILSALLSSTFVSETAKCLLRAKDYHDFFDELDPDWLKICRYLIFIATEPDKDAAELISATVGSTFRECTVPVPEKEPEDFTDIDYTDLSAVYRWRLFLETILKNPGIYDEVEDYQRIEQSTLKKVKAACGSEEGYKVWKSDLVKQKTDEKMRDNDLIVVKYLFAGMGQYDDVIPRSMLPSFLEWIQGNGSAFYGGERPAERKDVRRYVSEHLIDDL